MCCARVLTCEFVGGVPALVCALVRAGRMRHGNAVICGATFAQWNGRGLGSSQAKMALKMVRFTDRSYGLLRLSLRLAMCVWRGRSGVLGRVGHAVSGESVGERIFSWSRHARSIGPRSSTRAR